MLQHMIVYVWSSDRGPCFQTIEVMPTVVLQETHHGVGVEEEAPACFGHARLEHVCLGHACLEVILEVSDGGTQLCRQQHKMGEETLTYRLIFLRGMNVRQTIIILTEPSQPIAR